MTRTSYPQTGKATTDAQYAELFEAVVGTGIRATDDLVVSADSTGLNVKVAPGFAVVNGVAFKSSAIETLSIPANGGSTTRIDTIVLRRDPAAAAVVDLVVHAGTASTSPAAPTLVQDVLGVWEEPLADVVVGPGAATITASNVSDRRRYGSGRVGVWTTSSRPADRVGRLGYNRDSGKFEGFDGAWRNLRENDDRYYTKGQIDGALGQRDGSIGNAQGRADDAWNRANNAQGRADDAWNRANNAQSRGDSAQNTANDAWGKANDAQGRAGNLEARLSGFSRVWTNAGVITPSAVGARTSQHVDFAGHFTSKPVVVVMPETGSPDKVSMSCSNITQSGCDVVIVRSDNTSATGWNIVAAQP